VRPAAGRLASTVLAAAALTLGCAAVAAPSHASIAWGVCAESNNIACGHLTVPLDPHDPSQGVITLALRRHRAPLGEARDAVIALAGGPGQSAIPFLSQFDALLGPIVATRDLIAFDQRGTGFSHPLSCAVFEHASEDSSPHAVSLCGGEIGQTRGLYTTAQTVADIEAIRQAGGYEKLVLYGTSYGTKVAERYAQEHPARVEALVLDSVVPPNGPEAFDLATFAAVPRVLRQLCSGGACAHITGDPVHDLAELVAHMGGGYVRGEVIDGDGHRHAKRVSSNDLLAILLAGDFDPILRSEFPAAIDAAGHGDTAALARLVARAQGGEDEEEESPEAFDAPLYYSTICDETSFPWNPAAGAIKRLREAKAALAAIAGGAFAPFTRANALALSDVPACAGWPQTPGGPESDGAALPDVPTLILSGADDLRTPTGGARAVAAQIPDAELLVAPNTGHSVLAADPTPCAHNALKSFFERRQIKRCDERTPPPLDLPTPLPPRSLADVPAAPGNSGLPGRTLQAALLSFRDFGHQLLLALFEHFSEVLLGSGNVRTGGLRAGWGGLVHGRIELHDYTYVPGVTLSGRLGARGTGTLRVGGRAAARGFLRLSSHGSLTGVLDGRRVHIARPPRRAEADFGFSPAVPARVSELAAHPQRLAGLRAHGIAALLRYVLAA
jgi:pimeloyl-ACP methyl ester carboxylesterase